MRSLTKFNNSSSFGPTQFKKLTNILFLINFNGISAISPTQKRRSQWSEYSAMQLNYQERNGV